MLFRFHVSVFHLYIDAMINCLLLLFQLYARRICSICAFLSMYIFRNCFPTQSRFFHHHKCAALCFVYDVYLAATDNGIELTCECALSIFETSTATPIQCYFTTIQLCWCTIVFIPYMRFFTWHANSFANSQFSTATAFLFSITVQVKKQTSLYCGHFCCCMTMPMYFLSPVYAVVRYFWFLKDIQNVICFDNQKYTQQEFKWFSVAPHCETERYFSESLSGTSMCGTLC